MLSSSDDSLSDDEESELELELDDELLELLSEDDELSSSDPNIDFSRFMCAKFSTSVLRAVRMFLLCGMICRIFEQKKWDPDFRTLIERLNKDRIIVVRI